MFVAQDVTARATVRRDITAQPVLRNSCRMFGWLRDCNGNSRRFNILLSRVNGSNGKPSPNEQDLFQSKSDDSELIYNQDDDGHV